MDTELVEKPMDMDTVTISKVARLESNYEAVTRDLATLTTDVRSLAASVKELSLSTEKKFETLLIAVKDAAAPRQTNWQTILSGAGLVIIIFAALYSHFDMRVTELQQHESILLNDFKEHTKLQLHPVGMAMMIDMEKSLKELDIKLQRETVLINSTMQEKLTGVEKNLADKVDAVNGMVTRRLTKLEEWQNNSMEAELKELRARRYKDSTTSLKP